jgi:chloride channel 7
MGAVGITAGITRLTISLTVMVLEGTGDMQYVLPLMLVVMAARLVGNVFTEGLYDIHIKARHLYYLEEVLSQTMSLSHETNALEILG